MGHGEVLLQSVRDLAATPASASASAAGVAHAGSLGRAEMAAATAAAVALGSVKSRRAVVLLPRRAESTKAAGIIAGHGISIGLAGVGTRIRLRRAICLIRIAIPVAISVAVAVRRGERVAVKTRGAGGIITDYQGNDPMFGNSIIAAGPGIHEEVIRLLNS